MLLSRHVAQLPVRFNGRRMPPFVSNKFLDHEIANNYLLHFVSSVGHVWLLENPKGHYSVIEPINGGCAKQSRERTSATASAHHCRVATNAGFFDPRDSMPSFGKCLGSVISKGKVIQSPNNRNGAIVAPVQNAVSLSHALTATAAFGLLKNGSFVIGMIPAEFVRLSVQPQLLPATYT